MSNKILTWALFVQKTKKNKIQSQQIVVTSLSFLEENFYPLSVQPSKIFLQYRCVLCNTYTLKLSCTTNLSRLSQVTIQVTWLLINTKFFSPVFTNLLSSIKNSSQATNKSTRLLQHYC